MTVTKIDVCVSHANRANIVFWIMGVIMMVYPRKDNKYWAAITLIFARKRYLALAIEHNLAVDIRATDMRSLFDQGVYPLTGWESQATEASAACAKQLSAGLNKSFFLSFFIFLMCVLFAVASGFFAPNLPISWAKCLSWVGAFFALWATWFQLESYAETWGGGALHEVVRTVLFEAIFLFGFTIGVLGLLW
ncbi:MAG: hypothetical protein RL571_2253 [Pseudomonadota bacterium]|jgi:hypothetical protein